MLSLEWLDWMRLRIFPDSRNSPSCLQSASKQSVELDGPALGDITFLAAGPASERRRSAAGGGIAGFSATHRQPAPPRARRRSRGGVSATQADPADGHHLVPRLLRRPERGGARNAARCRGRLGGIGVHPERYTEVERTWNGRCPRGACADGRGPVPPGRSGWDALHRSQDAERGSVHARARRLSLKLERESHGVALSAAAGLAAGSRRNEAGEGAPFAEACEGGP